MHAGRANELTRGVAAAVHHDDTFDDREHSPQTADAVRGLQPWITRTCTRARARAHDGVRVDGAVFDRPPATTRGEARH